MQTYFVLFILAWSHNLLNEDIFKLSVRQAEVTKEDFDFFFCWIVEASPKDCNRAVRLVIVTSSLELGEDANVKASIFISE